MRLSPSRLALGVALAGAMLSFPAHAQQTKTSLSNYNYYYVYANGMGYVTAPIVQADIAGVINSMCGLAQASDCVLPAGVAAANLNFGSGVLAALQIPVGSTGAFLLNSSINGTGSIVATNSPAFTGTPTAPTNGAVSDSTTQIATDAFVQNAITANTFTGPNSAVSGDIPTFNGTSGHVVQDSGINIAAGALTGLTTPLSPAQGGSGVASPTAHTVPLNEGSSAQNNTGAGTLGQSLISNGSGVDPSWKSGARTLLNTLTASGSANLQDTTSLTGSYSEYDIVLENLVPATTTTTCEIQVQSGGSFQTTTYVGGGVLASSSGAISNGLATTYIPCSYTDVTAAAPGVSGTFHVSNVAQTSSPKTFVGTGASPATTNNYQVGTFFGYWNGGNGAITGIQVLFSAGNITSGVIKIYGYN